MGVEVKVLHELREKFSAVSERKFANKMEIIEK